MSTRFFLDSRCNRHGEYAIRMSISLNGSRFCSTLGCCLDRKEWEKGVSAQYVNAAGVRGEEILRRMATVREGMLAWEERLRGRKPQVEEIRRQVKVLLKGKTLSAYEPVGVIACMDEFIGEQRMVALWSEGTVNSMLGLRRHLQRFCPGEECDFFDEPGLEAWLRYLRESARLEESSVRKTYMQLRWFLSWALRKGYAGDEAVLRYRPKFKLVPKPVIFLTKCELLTLYNYIIPRDGTEVTLKDSTGRQYVKLVKGASTLEKVRDLFCFCAFTSLRYSDMAQLRRDDVTPSMLYVTSKKTHDCLPIDLCSKARDILKKYESLPDGRVLPVISCQQMNRYLKVLCELCGINKPIVKVFYHGGIRHKKVYPKYALVGTHAARRTFICFALSQGIPPQVVMKWTGHSDYKAMQPYIDIASEVTASAMRKMSAAWGK